MLPQPGLKWVLNKCFEAEPTWTHDPKVKTIIKLARQHLQLSDNDKCTADYYMQGAFNKIYLIRCPRSSANEQSFIFRVSLPVDPGFKVASDVATMTFVRTHTDAPVPRVLAFDPSQENELGFAWTIMEMMPGRPLCEQWRYMTWMQKEELVKRVADIVAQMFRHRFRGIGNIYQKQGTPPYPAVERNGPGPTHHAINNMTKSPPAIAGCSRSGSNDDVDKDCPASNYNVDRIVSMSFLWHNRVHYEVHRGPFSSSFDWLKARLDFVIIETDDILNDPTSDPNRKASATKHSSLAKRVRQQLPNFFPEPRSKVSPEITTLHHYDMSGFNVLVDGEGRLTALLDWDGVSTVPLWKACQMPEFLVSRFIDEIGDDKPGHIDSDSAASRVSKDEAIALEKEHFRASFLAEMERVEPEWTKIYWGSVRSTDFESAVHLCDSLFKSHVVDNWLKGIEEGKEYRSLRQLLLARK
jgi:Phosphotransferase enzyme family